MSSQLYKRSQKVHPTDDVDSINTVRCKMSKQQQQTFALCCFILDCGADTHQPSASFLLLSVHPQGAGIWVKPSMHGQEFSCLDVSGIYLLIWPTYYPGEVSDHRHGVGVDCPDFVLPI